MKTFNMVFTLLFLSSLFVTSCSDTTEQIYKPVLTLPTPIEMPTSSFTDQQRVCTLLEATIAMLTTDSKTIDEYFDEDLWILLEIEYPTSGELEEIEDLALEGIGNMFTSDGAFQSALNAVVGLELTRVEFEGYIENCEIEQFSGNNGSRWCIICSTFACANTATLSELGYSLGNGNIAAAGWLGQFIHCNH